MRKAQFLSQTRGQSERNFNSLILIFYLLGQFFMPTFPSRRYLCEFLFVYIITEIFSHVNKKGRVAKRKLCSTPFVEINGLFFSLSQVTGSVDQSHIQLPRHEVNILRSPCSLVPVRANKHFLSPRGRRHTPCTSQYPLDLWR